MPDDGAQAPSEPPRRIVSPHERATAEVGDGREWEEVGTGTYVHGEGNAEYVIVQEVIEDQEEVPGFANWLPTLAVAAGGLLALVAHLGWQLGRHLHRAAHAASSGGHWTGQQGNVFAYLVAGAAVVLLVKFVTGSFRGRD